MKLKFHHLIYLLILSLPFYGYPLINLQVRAIRWDWAILLLMIGLVTLQVLTAHGFRVYRSKIFVWLGITNIFLLMSSFNPIMSGDYSNIIDFASSWVLYVLNSVVFVIVCCLKVNSDILRKVIKLYLWTALGVCVYGLIQFAGMNLFGWDLYLNFTSVKYEASKSGYAFLLGDVKRATSVFVEPRHFGVYMIVPFFISLLHLVKWDHGIRLFRKGFNRLIVLLFGIGILVSLSLAAFLGFGIALLVFPFISRVSLHRVLPSFMFIVIAGVTSLALVEIIWNIGVMEYVGTRLLPSRYELNHLLDYEIHLGGPPRYVRGAILAFEYLIQHPMTGIGLNQYESIVPYDVIALPPFNLMASIGVFGFSSFVCFMYLLVRSIDSLRRRACPTSSFLLDTALIMVLLTLVNSLFAARYNYPSTMFWFGMSIGGMILFNVRRWEREQQEGHHEASPS